MDKINEIKKIFYEKIFNNKNTYNYSTNILIISIRDNIEELIINYYLFDNIEFDFVKDNLIKNLSLLRNKNYFMDNLYFVCGEMINLLLMINYPLYLGLNKITSLKINNSKGKIKFFHKSTSFDIKNNYYDYCYSKDNSSSSDESEYNNTKRKIIKNKAIFNDNNKKHIKPMDKNISKDKNKIEIDKFTGKLNNFPNSKLCIYCDKYIDKSYFIPIDNTNTLDYCIHCWAWLNCNEINLEQGTYNGNLNQNTVFEYIENTSLTHKQINCTNQFCLFNQYDKLCNLGKLSGIFNNSKINSQSKNNEEKINKKEYKILSRDIIFDWKKSVISI